MFNDSRYLDSWGQHEPTQSSTGQRSIPPSAIDRLRQQPQLNNDNPDASRRDHHVCDGIKQHSGTAVQTDRARVTPIATLNPPANTSITAFTVDPSGNIYVGAELQPPNSNTISYEVLVYAAGATGAATPIRTITGFPEFVTSLAVDASGANLCNGRVRVFFVSISTPPMRPEPRFLSGRYNSSQILQLGKLSYTIGLDGADNIFFTTLSPGDETAVYSSTATGNASPIRIVSILMADYAAAVDTAGNIYALVVYNRWKLGRI